MNDLKEQAKSIFLNALEIAAPQDRKAYLDSECGADGVLRGEVEDLLQHQAQVSGFLESPALGIATEATPIREGPGSVIGPYKLLQQIGEGGFGVVFMAEQIEPVRRKVALKVIKPGMDTRQVIARFEAERQALAVMDHINIARVLDAGTIGEKDEGKTEGAGDSSFIPHPSSIRNVGRPYFVMELVRGIAITQYCDDNHLPIRERLELFASVCQAIQHAHTKGIIHRDIKPTNILVTRHDGRPVVKVIDFGIAKAMGQQLTDRTLFTNFAQMIGTPLYMSPEQAELSGMDIDTRSDIYSLGVLLYELLTGSTPVSKEQLQRAAFDEVRRIIREDEPPKPSTRISSAESAPSIAAQRLTEPAKLARLVRGDLDWIVMKALEKDRSRRYETANGLLADVRRYLDDEPVHACPPSASYRLRKFARRNRIAITTASLVGMALLMGTAISTWQAIRATAAGELAETRLQAQTAAQQATEKQLRLTEQAESKAQHRLFDAWIAQANAGVLSRRVGQRFDSLQTVAQATKLARDLNFPEQRFLELRNAAIAGLALPDVRLAKQWSGWPVNSNSIGFDQALDYYARGDCRGSVSVRRVADDQEVTQLPGSGYPVSPNFSANGKYLAVISSNGIVTIWNLGRSPPVVVSELPAADHHGFAFSSDSRQCAAGHGDGSISFYDLDPWRTQHRMAGGDPVTYLAYHPDDRQLAVARDSVVEIVELDSERVTPLQNPSTVNYLAWRPDGKSLAAACNDERIYLWDLTTPQPRRQVLKGHKNGGISLGFSHAGDLLASVDWDNILRLWDTGTGQQRFEATAAVPVPCFSSDDRLLVGQIRGDQVGVWEVAAGREYRTMSRAAESVEAKFHSVSIRFDGRLLAVGMSGGVGLWDLHSGREIGFLELPGDNCALFEPSGSLLTTGSTGLIRWPVRLEPGLVRLGPPQVLPVPGAFTKLACSRDGRVIASAQFQGAMVLHADRPDEPVRLGPHDDVRHVAVSPDGHRVATGSFLGTGVKIWDADTGKLAKELPWEPPQVAFSPDGKWLVTAWGICQIWHVGSWRKGPHAGSGQMPAFSPDGKILAMQDSDYSVRVIDPETGRDYGRLRAPHQEIIVHMCFSPDGTQLVACNNSKHSIHVWNLRPIREQLSGLGLDWNLPPYPTAVAERLEPLHVTIELGNLSSSEELSRLGAEAADRLNAK